jgi:predicted nucleic acid-binding protein
MSLLVVDTDVVSYVFRAHPSSDAYLAILDGQELISSFMTRAEMQLGARLRKWGPGRVASLERYLARFGVCCPDSALCDLWAEVMAGALRAGRPIGLQDAWIAATALQLAAPLVTGNVRHFRHVPGLEIRSAGNQ